MNLLKKIKSQLTQIRKMSGQFVQLQANIHKIQESLGRIESRQLQAVSDKSLNANEFRVFSQWGEDGIIQFLLNHIRIERPIFVEFGVQNYTESNTRFLLCNNNWAGLVIDGSEENINFIKQDPIYWQHNLKAVHAFIDKDNINPLIVENGITGEIGLLSIDIDGNDYWIWQAIDVVNPAIVIVEYNYRFGKDKAMTIPYNKEFIRNKAHYSMIYYGASLKALCLLAQKKGYVFVGSNSAGNNAFFVRQNIKPDYIKEITVEDGYRIGQFRESRNEQGQLLYLSLEEEEKILASLPLVEVK